MIKNIPPFWKGAPGCLEAFIVRGPLASSAHAILDSWRSSSVGMTHLGWTETSRTTRRLSESHHGISGYCVSQSLEISPGCLASSQCPIPRTAGLTPALRSRPTKLPQTALGGGPQPGVVPGQCRGEHPVEAPLRSQNRPLPAPAQPGVTLTRRGTPCNSPAGLIGSPRMPRGSWDHDSSLAQQ